MSGGIEYIPELGACFLDTGTRHLVKFVDSLHSMDVASEGRALRYDSRFAPQGTNVNFVQVAGRELHVRTFEKGVEAETLACGTGVVASAVAASVRGVAGEVPEGGGLKYSVRTALAMMEIEFRSSGEGGTFMASDVWLTGPAAFVGTIECLL